MYIYFVYKIYKIHHSVIWCIQYPLRVLSFDSNTSGIQHTLYSFPKISGLFISILNFIFTTLPTTLCLSRG